MPGHWIVFSFDRKDDFPVLLSYSLDLKEENVRQCKTKIVIKSENHFSTHIKIEPNINVVLTYSDEPCAFVRGYVYANGKEYEVVKTANYPTLQIGNFCYDNICTVQLDTNIFTDNREPLPGTI